MNTEILIKIAIIVFILFAITRVVNHFGGIINMTAMIVSLPGTAILRAVVMIATLPAAFSMMMAEKELASLIGKSSDADQVERIRLKMASSAKSAWFNAQADNEGTSYAFRLARAFA